jgi:hypothetical protein
VLVGTDVEAVVGVAPPLDLDVISRLQLDSTLIGRHHRYRLSCAHRRLVVVVTCKVPSRLMDEGNRWRLVGI